MANKLDEIHDRKVILFAIALLLVVVLCLVGCERPVPPQDGFIYSTINQKPDGSFIPIGVELDTHTRLMRIQQEKLDQARENCRYYADHNMRLKEQIAEAEARIAELELKAGR